MKKKRILLITPFSPPQLGGAETHLEDLYEYLRSKGYKVTLLTYQPIVSKNLKGKSIERRGTLTIHRYQWFGNNLFTKFESFPPIFNFLYITPYLFIRSLIFMIGNHKKYDVIHVFGLNAAFIARALKFVYHKRIVFSAEALYNFKPLGFFSTICHWVLMGFDTILVGSEESRQDFLSLKIPDSKIKIYVHWLRLDNFKPGNKTKLRSQLGWKNTFTVLFVGRLIGIKGIRVFIETAKLFKNIVQFKIIGDEGTELKFVKKWATKLENLEYIGSVKNTEIGKYFSAADVYLYPALYQEDLARVLLESMACGTPVMNTNKGSGIYKLTPEVGFVTKANPKEIKARIESLRKHPKKLEEMSKASIAFASKFGPRLGKIITDTYEKEENKS